MPDALPPMAHARWFCCTGTSSTSIFANSYHNGDMPCRLVHGSVTHKLEWTTDPPLLSYDPLLLIFAQGLVETVHPYYFVARAGFHELLCAHGAGKKALPMLKRLVSPLRAALVSPSVHHRRLHCFVAQCGQGQRFTGLPVAPWSCCGAHCTDRLWL